MESAMADLRKWQVGDLEYDATTGTVRRTGETLIEKGRTLELFEALVSAAPEPLDTEALAQAVWRREHVSNDTISKRVSLLRQALGSDHYVQTLPDRRYRLAVPVEPVAGDVQSTAPTTERARPTFLGIGLFAFIVILSIFWIRQIGGNAPQMEGPHGGAPAQMVSPDGAVLTAPPEAVSNED